MRLAPSISVTAPDNTWVITKGSMKMETARPASPEVVAKDGDQVEGARGVQRADNNAQVQRQ